ncbi:ATP-dependent zinc metalloprotease FtsH [compost metagenome]
MLIGGMVAYLRKLPPMLLKLLKNRTIFSVYLEPGDQSIQWIHDYIIHSKNHHSLKQFLLSTREIEKKDSESTNKTEINYQPEVKLAPAPGIHFFFYKNMPSWMVFKREIIEKDKVFIGNHDNISINILGGSKTTAKSLINDAYLISNKKNNNEVQVFIASYGSWKSCGYKLARPINTLVFDDDLCRNIIDDANDSINNKEWYLSMGIPWRRGYLLYGDPGNGKSSLVMAIASAFNVAVYSVNLASQTLSEERLEFLFSEVPAGSILLIEEIDTVFNGRNLTPNQNSTGPSLGSVLNALDGVAASEGRLLFITTNHKEKLDPALIRPGRVDLQIHLRNASRNQMLAMFKKFFPHSQPSEAKAFADALPEYSVSMANLQQFFIKNRACPEVALQNIGELARKQVSLK